MRPKKGTYAGDLAQVVEVDPQVTRATLKLIPRLESSNRRADDGTKATVSGRLPQRMFDPLEYGCKEVKRKGPKKFFYWGGNTFRKGFIYKEESVRNLTAEHVVPTLEELLLFKPLLAEGEEPSSDDEKTEALISSQKRSSGIAKGDRVKATKGELAGLLGVVVSINDSLGMSLTPLVQSPSPRSPKSSPATYNSPSATSRKTSSTATTSASSTVTTKEKTDSSRTWRRTRCTFIRSRDGTR